MYNIFSWKYRAHGMSVNPGEGRDYTLSDSRIKFIALEGMALGLKIWAGKYLVMRRSDAAR